MNRQMYWDHIYQAKSVKRHLSPFKINVERNHHGR